MAKKSDRGGITHISNLFAHYAKRLNAPPKVVAKEFVEIVKNEIGVVIDPGQVKYSPHSKILSVNCAGPIKNEIFFKKEFLLQELKTKVGEKSAPTNIL